MVQVKVKIIQAAKPKTLKKHLPVYLIGNWKMNPTELHKAKALFEFLDGEVGLLMMKESVKVAVCISPAFLFNFSAKNEVKLGVQNIFWEDSGAFTGEVSPLLAKNAGMTYALIGHSERRKYLGETDEMINWKVKAALRNNLMPVVCVGETEAERESGEAGEVIMRQVQMALEGLKWSEVEDKLLIAYEPVWAIGSGKLPTTDEMMSAHLLIKKTLGKHFGERAAAENVPVLYGGSVTGDNAVEIIQKTGMNGLLIGGVSLKGPEFLRVIKGVLEK